MESNQLTLGSGRRLLVALLVVALAAVLIPGTALGAKKKFVLTILHNNDGESQLINAGSGAEDFGGIARFASLVQKLENRALKPKKGEKRESILLSSGDNFLAGPEFNASLTRGAPFFDTTALSLIGYDAFAIGNHEFDFGPDVFADFLQAFPRPRKGFFGHPFVSANLDFSNEPGLQKFVNQNKIVKSTILRKSGERIGIVGATTEELRSISSPRNTIINAVAPAVQAEIDRLEAAGVNKIVLISHQQSVNEDIDLVGMLSGVDIAIAGGGDELLVNGDELLVPGDDPDDAFGSYPLTAKNADGDDVPIVTTPGDYKYVGRLIVQFNRQGKVSKVRKRSGLVRVAGGDNPDAVRPNPQIQSLVTDPVQSSVAGLAANIIAQSEVALEGRRSPGIRTMETNLGNLTADSLLWQARQLASGAGLGAPDVALQNGGGIRNNNLIPAGPISVLTTFDILPFSNFVTQLDGIPASQFKEIMENAVSGIEDVEGRFAQIAGFTMTFDLSGTAQVLDDEGNVTTPGTRVKSIVLDDGRVIVQNGAVVAGAPAVNIVTIDFLARGGDDYPFRGAAFTVLGVSYQQALRNYIEQALAGKITAAQYPEAGSGRITELP